MHAWLCENPTGIEALTWKELQGPPVTPPRRAGFGSKLFRAGFAQASGSLKLDYKPDGLQCRLTFACL